MKYHFTLVRMAITKKTYKQSILEKVWRQYKHLPGIGRRGGMSRQITEDFQGSENTLHGIIMMDLCCYTFVQTHSMYNTK